MNFIDKQHFALVEVVEDCCEVTASIDRGSGCGSNVDTQLFGDDVRKRRFTEAWRTREQDMVKGITAGDSGANVDSQIVDDF